jgi:biotin carboxyl carrier protein
MNVTVKIGERTFVVEVGDLRARPVVTTIDGEQFEVWPEGEPSNHRAPLPRPASLNGARVVPAPIPGVIISVAVQPGTQVSTGQELCVLEAMKMKSAIRAARAGRIGAVHVSAGQHVTHRQPLMEYDE